MQCIWKGSLFVATTQLSEASIRSYAHLLIWSGRLGSSLATSPSSIQHTAYIFGSRCPLGELFDRRIKARLEIPLRNEMPQLRDNNLRMDVFHYTTRGHTLSIDYHMEGLLLS